jgi:hypothetical protein
MEIQSRTQSHESPVDQEARIDRFNSFMDVIDAVKDVYDEGGEYSDSTTCALLGGDLARTKMARDRVLER